MHVREFAQPTVVILSAEYGFVRAGSYLRPYERRMTAERGKEIIAGLDQEIHKLKWLSGMRHVYLAGGQTYQSVMLACIDRLKSLKVLPIDIVVEVTHGALGFQRAQLGAYLRSLPDARDVVGRHPNGTPILQDAWGFTIDQEVSVSRSSHGGDRIFRGNWYASTRKRLVPQALTNSVQVVTPHCRKALTLKGISPLSVSVCTINTITPTGGYLTYGGRKQQSAKLFVGEAVATVQCTTFHPLNGRTQTR